MTSPNIYLKKEEAFFKNTNPETEIQFSPSFTTYLKPKRSHWQRWLRPVKVICNISKTSASVSSGFPNTIKLFSSVWKPR